MKKTQEQDAENWFALGELLVLIGVALLVFYALARWW